MPAADRGLTALIAIGGDHLACRIEQHLARLVDRAPTRDDRRPLGELGHRPTVLVGCEHGSQRHGIAHGFTKYALARAGAWHPDRLEVSEPIDGPLEQFAWTGPQDYPFGEIPFLAFVLDDPADVRDAALDRAPYARKPRIVDKDDRAFFSSRPA
jgi:hypothetical protein